MKFRLKRIGVRNLFGRLSYDINLSLEGNVTAIIGPNGVGKTTIMKMANDAVNLPKNPSESFLFGKSYFDSFSLLFSADDQTGISFVYKTKVLKNNRHKLSAVTISLFSPGNEPFSNEVKLHKPRDIGSLVLFLKRGLPLTKSRHINYEILMDFYIQTEFVSASRIESDTSRETENKFFDDLLEGSNLSVGQSNKIQSIFREENSSIQISRHLSRKMEADEAAIQKFLSSEGIRLKSFGYRFVLSCFYCFSTLDPKSLLSKIAYLQNKKILDSGQARQIQNEIESNCENALAVISGYSLEEFLKSASIGVQRRQAMASRGGHPISFSSSRNRISALFESSFSSTPFLAASSLLDMDSCALSLDRLSKLFTDPFETVIPMDISFSRDEGFMASVGPASDPINIQSLSSGQLNILVVFYTVLFNTRDEILFIDEPENSLHIMWQEKYLNALISAAKEKDVQIVVATHSPFITMGHEPITERITLIHDRLD